MFYFINGVTKSRCLKILFFKLIQVESDRYETFIYVLRGYEVLNTVLLTRTTDLLFK